MTASRSSKPQPYHHGDLRNALVQAAVELAREGGPSAIVLREAARRVGVSPTAAYRHFEALPDLVEAVAQHAFTELAHRMEAEVARCRPSGDAKRDAVNHLSAVGRGYVNFAVDEPGLFTTAFTREKRTVTTDGPTGESGLSPAGLQGRALDNMVTVGALAPEDRGAAASAAWAAVHGLSYLLLGPMRAVPTATRDAIIESTLDLVGRGLIVRG